MTEAEWLAATDPTPMLNVLRDRADQRKWRLFAVECCRRAVNDFGYTEFEPAILCGSKMAEDLPYNVDLRRAQEIVDAWIDQPSTTHHYVAEAIQVTILPHLIGVDDARRVVRAISAAFAEANFGSGGREEYRAQAHLLREFFGTTYPIGVNRQWLMSTVVTLAEGIYAD